MIEQAYGIGVLATIEESGTRLRPLEFSRVDGELWAAISRRAQQHTRARDGQHVEVLFMNEEFDHALVRGVLEWSTDPNDRRRLWEIQQDVLNWSTGADDPNLVILKIVPDPLEHLVHPNDKHSRRKAA